MADDRQLIRGTVWGYPFEIGAQLKPAVIVSTNERNVTRWPDIHVVRITTAPRPRLDTIVELGHDDAPLVGRALCDEVRPVPKAELGRRWSALSPHTMARIDAALRLVFDLH